MLETHGLRRTFCSRRSELAVLGLLLLTAASCTGSFAPPAPSPGPTRPSAAPTLTPTPTPRPEPIRHTEREYAGGRYTLAVPGSWNGGLVLYAHGYQGEGGAGNLENPPLATWWLSQGFAWAASSYRSAGYHVDWFIDDMLALRDIVVSQLGAPRWTILYGMSMGGHLVTSSLELHPGVYQAALAECGVLDGVGETDYQVAYAAAAEYISGVPLLDPPDAATFQQRVGQWLQVMGQPGSYTEKGRQFDSVVKYLSGGDLPHRLEGLSGNRYTANLGPHPEPARASTSTPIRRSADTRQILYHIDPGLGLTDEELNANVRRFAPAPGARSRANNPVFADLTGQLSVPLLTLHTTGDPWVPMALEQAYRRKTLAAGTDQLLVQRAIQRAGHCDFSSNERRQAFTDLVAWMEHGVTPQGDDVLAPDVSKLGLRWTVP